MKIEVLYPELCNLYGDRGNIDYLKKCVKAKFVETTLADQPYFVDNDVDMIYLGSMTEKSQKRIIEKLKPYKDRIQELIDKDVIFLLVGNSSEIFVNFIETEDNKKIEGLGLFDFYAKRIIPKRANALFLGTFAKKEIVGYVSRFSHTYGDNSQNYLFKVEKGLGMNPDTHLEGFRIHNVFATYLLGPLLVQNPYFTEYLLKLLGVKKPILAFKKEVMKAYQVRLEEFHQDIHFGGH